MSDPRYIVIDRYATTASALRPKSTSVNPRYWIKDTATGQIVDELTTKGEASATARDMNREDAQR